MINFILGVIVGTSIGILIMALCVAASGKGDPS